MDLDKCIAELEQKRKETKERAAKKAAAKKALDRAALKAAMKRKQKLVGEFLLHDATNIGSLRNEKNERFDSWLADPDVRKLFGFPTLFEEPINYTEAQYA